MKIANDTQNIGIKKLIIFNFFHGYAQIRQYESRKEREQRHNSRMWSRDNTGVQSITRNGTTPRFIPPIYTTFSILRAAPRLVRSLRESPPGTAGWRAPPASNSASFLLPAQSRDCAPSAYGSAAGSHWRGPWPGLRKKPEFPAPLFAFVRGNPLYLRGVIRIFAHNASKGA
jgi:hypothetical protein